ncbi:hypothetical protein PGT21_004858 [Puccinia graminis f. sp. tritici]|uniref:Lysophospholipase n=1 Tax=Puccinia graminis f. sp. tritici TaxID=56615 RepID=A0A5B0NUP4_PUCGR|nr:hypothetical protein PGT21_004858 [Puccinia graminis f. sp. tritici]KAA1093593.1 hypothetical protein PGTUg99_002312 [Puccinia graminis f. sp. tritici]
MRLPNTHLTLKILLWGHTLFGYCKESQAADSSRATTPLPTPKSYAPEKISCPASLSVSISSTYPWPTSSAEQAYISSKTTKSLKTWEDYLCRVNLTGFDVKEFLKNSTRDGQVAGRNLPNIAFSLSGGGNRALLYAASIMDAFDSRNPQANEARTGGVLQLANFASGLSASSWLLASWGNANFIRFPELADNAWHSAFTHGYFSWKRMKHYPHHYRDLRKKKKAGFHVSVVDIWGRILSKNLLNDPDVGRTLTLSSLRSKSEYVEQSVPFPILVTTSRKQEGADLDLDSPIYEFTPEDINVWHPTLNATFPIEYLGSKAGAVTNKATECVTGFDNLGFLMGASSNIFSYQDGKKISKSMLAGLASMFVKGRFYEALVPNPFMGQGMGPAPGTGYPDGERDELLLADGAMAQESMPLFPLLQPSRMVDVILAVDSSVDGRAFDNPNQKGYPNGTSLYRTSMKLQQEGYRGFKFPEVPETYKHTTFTDRGYHRRPTFFGCDKDVPLVVYIPNHFVTKDTSQSTMQAVYKKEDIKGFFENGFYVATQTHSSQNDTEWPSCLACALVDRQNTRNGMQRTPQCISCFTRYCASGF